MTLHIHNVSKRYGGKTAVDQLNLTLEKGVYGLLGANGAGKTTLMRLICAIQKPTAGYITWKGKNIQRLGERYQRLLGYLPQHFGYYPDFTAQEFLLYLSALKGIDQSAARFKAMALLEAVGLDKTGRQKIKTFSGGMKQRLGIAQALLNDPQILILDEPTAGLDPKERVRFRNLISAFAQERIVLLSTHIVSDVEFIAEEIIILRAGQIRQSGKADDVTAIISGCVWECLVSADQAEACAGQFNVSNLKNIDGEQAILRIISQRPPLSGARPVRANLEDLYLFYEKGDEANESAFRF